MKKYATNQPRCAVITPRGPSGVRRVQILGTLVRRVAGAPGRSTCSDKVISFSNTVRRLVHDAGHRCEIARVG
jgi:hypothetical protein